jgi:hypothetical protein
VRRRSPTDALRQSAGRRFANARGRAYARRGVLVGDRAAKPEKLISPSSGVSAVFGALATARPRAVSAASSDAVGDLLSLPLPSPHATKIPYDAFSASCCRSSA